MKSRSSFVRKGKRSFLTLILVQFLCWPLSTQVQAAAGDTDPTFGLAGKVTTDFSPNQDEARAIAVQPDGKLIAAGTNQLDFALARYNIDGTLDTTFGTNGKTTTDFFGIFEDEAFALAIQPDGKIVAAGRARSNTNISFPLGFAMARYNSNGSLDLSFGAGGKVYTPILGQQDEARAIAVQSDDKILLAGSAFNGSIFEFAIARYNSDGSLDPTFGSGGKLLADLAGGNGAFAIATQTDGRIVVAGDGFDSITGFDFALLRYNSDGTADPAFGNNGITLTDFSNHPFDEALAITIQPDGKIIAAGVSGDSGLFFRDFALARYNANGALDPTFGSSGKVTTDFFGDLDIAHGVAIQADGRIIATGSAHSFTPNSDFALSRYNPNGSLDTSFGVGGKVTADFFGDADESFDIALQPDGKVVVAGRAVNNGSASSEFALMRLNGVESFDTCLQDDSNHNILQLNSATGAYQFTKCGAGGFIVSGTGMITVKGSTVTLQHYPGDRRILARIDNATKKGSASLQFFSPAMSLTITDRNTMNNTCSCP